jgi:hypothetical protein
MHSSPPCLNFNKTSAHGVANNVASRLIVQEPALEGCGWQQKNIWLWRILWQFLLFFATLEIFQHPLPCSNFYKTSTHHIASKVAGPLAVEEAVAATPPLWQNSPNFPPKWKFMHTSLPCSNFSKKNAPGIASDVGTLCVVLEQAPKGHRGQQRRWQKPILIWFHRKKSVGVMWNASGTIAIFVATLA